MKFIGTIRQSKLEKKLVKDTDSGRKEEKEVVPIFIDKVLRAAISAKTNTKLYVFPVLSHDDESIYREVIISQYPPFLWDSIFRLRFWAQDKPGVTKTIFEKLKDTGINITTQESIMTKYDKRFFTISLVADFSGVLLEVKEKVKLDVKLKQAKEKLKEIFEEVQELKEYKEAEDNPTVKPLRQLNYHSGNYITHIPINDIQDEKLKKYRAKVAFHNAFFIQDGIVNIDRKITDDLKLEYSDNIFYTVNADTEEKYTIIRFFHCAKRIIQLDIEHKSHEPGILFKLSEFITRNKREEYNIINSYDRIQDHQNNSHWIVMIDCTSAPKQIENLIQEIKSFTGKKVFVKSVTNNFLAEVPDLKKRFKLKKRKRISLTKSQAFFLLYFITCLVIAILQLYGSVSIIPEKLLGLTRKQVLDLLSLGALFVFGIVLSEVYGLGRRWLSLNIFKKEE